MKIDQQHGGVSEKLISVVKMWCLKTAGNPHAWRLFATVRCHYVLSLPKCFRNQSRWFWISTRPPLCQVLDGYSQPLIITICGVRFHFLMMTRFVGPGFVCRRKCIFNKSCWILVWRKIVEALRTIWGKLCGSAASPYTHSQSTASAILERLTHGCIHNWAA